MKKIEKVILSPVRPNGGVKLAVARNRDLVDTNSISDGLRIWPRKNVSKIK
jgi:hypothetical protein